MDYSNLILEVVELNGRTRLSETDMSIINTHVTALNQVKSDTQEPLTVWTAYKAVEALLNKHNIELEFHNKRTMESTVRVLTVKLKSKCEDLLPMIEGLFINMADNSYSNTDIAGGLLELIVRLDERFTDSTAAAIESYISDLYTEDESEDEAPENKEPVVVEKESIVIPENKEDEIKKESVKVENKPSAPTKVLLIEDVIKQLDTALEATKNVTTVTSSECVTIELKVVNFKINKITMDSITDYFNNADMSVDRYMVNCAKILTLALAIKKQYNFDILMKIPNVDKVRAMVLEFLLNNTEI